MHEIIKKNLKSGGICTINIPTPKTMPRHTILFFHGFASDKDEVGNTFKDISSHLLKENFITVQVSFPGFGETKTTLENTSFDSLINTANETYQEIEQLAYIDKNHISLCCFSLGCVIGAITYKKSPIPIKKIAFISPALDLIKDFSIVLGESVVSKAMHSLPKEKVEIEFWSKGTRLTSKVESLFFQKMKEYPPIEYLKSYEGELFIICGREDFSYENTMIYNRSLARAKSTEIIVIPNADHIFNAFSPNTTLEEVKLKTAQWLATRYI